MEMHRTIKNQTVFSKKLKNISKNLPKNSDFGTQDAHYTELDYAASLIIQ
jgi:hypothetical protein